MDTRCKVPGWPKGYAQHAVYHVGCDAIHNLVTHGIDTNLTHVKPRIQHHTVRAWLRATPLRTATAYHLPNQLPVPLYGTALHYTTSYEHDYNDGSDGLTSVAL